jgi:hypothetical protein
MLSKKDFDQPCEYAGDGFTIHPGWVASYAFHGKCYLNIRIAFCCGQIAGWS